MTRELIVKDIYNFRNRNYLFKKLENYDRKEPVDLGDYTTEHIMPQNEDLSPEWQAELGSNWKDIQANWLHTIGNLTLTGYNPELSDKSFREKRDMKGGFRDSPIRLNHSLASLDQWNDPEIQQRAQELASVAVKIWPIPKLSPEILSKYSELSAKEKAQTYTLEHFGNFLQSDVGELFSMLRKRILNLDSSVKEEVKKLYIAYKTTTNFVDVVPQKRQLRLSLNMEFNEINDPEGLCKDVSKVGRWGNGDVEVVLSSLDQIEYVMSLIRQSFDKYYETAEG